MGAPGRRGADRGPGGSRRDGWVYRPGQFGRITAQTLLLSGSESTPAIKRATDAAAAAIAGARIHVLDGHAHVAHRTHPAMAAALVREFIASST